MSGNKIELRGLVAPPMSNGEVIFEEPWQSRAFGMARALCERHLFEWDQFRDRLIDEIEKANPDSDYCYFDHLLEALVRLMDETGLCEAYDLSGREKMYADRRHGHDHVH